MWLQTPFACTLSDKYAFSTLAQHQEGVLKPHPLSRWHRHDHCRLLSCSNILYYEQSSPRKLWLEEQTRRERERVCVCKTSSSENLTPLTTCPSLVMTGRSIIVSDFSPCSFPVAHAPSGSSSHGVKKSSFKSRNSTGTLDSNPGASCLYDVHIFTTIRHCLVFIRLTS